MFSISVFANEKQDINNERNLLASCQSLSSTPDHTNSKHCIYFIQGFLAASQAIETSIIDKQNKKLYRPYRTRGRMLPKKFTHFCVPENESENQVIQTVSNQLPASIESEKMLRDVIFNTLKSEYPCIKV